jgi:hypothetical protein
MGKQKFTAELKEGVEMTPEKEKMLKFLNDMLKRPDIENKLFDIRNGILNALDDAFLFGEGSFDLKGILDD